MFGGLVYQVEAVGHFIAERARRAKSGSHRSYIQLFLLPTAMTAMPLQTRQRAKALKCSLAADDGTITGASGTVGVTISRLD